MIPRILFALAWLLWTLLWPVRWYNALPRPPHVPLWRWRREPPIETTPDRGASTEPWNDAP